MKLLNSMVNPLAHIVCRDGNRLIGLGDKLPWKCIEDMKYFQSVTRNKILILGYNTYKSIKDVYNKSLSNPIDPILRDRISIVIADPTRSDIPQQQLTFTGITKLIQLYSMETHDSSKLLGFNVFVESLEQAIHVAGIISTTLKSAMSPANGYGEWYRDIGSPIAFVIGGSKLYKETLERAYVSEIYETVLPIWCTIRDDSKPYYYPDIDGTVYRRATLMRSRCKVTSGAMSSRGYMDVYKHKRKIDIDSIQ